MVKTFSRVISPWLYRFQILTFCVAVACFAMQMWFLYLLLFANLPSLRLYLGGDIPC